MKKKDMLTYLAIAALPGGLVAIGAYWLLTRCWHKFSQPFTILGITYVVCLECGKEFEYDLKAMKIGKEMHYDWYRARHPISGAARLDSVVAEITRREAEADPHVREAEGEDAALDRWEAEGGGWDTKQAS